MMLMSDSILMRLSRYQTMWSSSMPMNSSIASSADRFDSTATVASDWLRQRPNVSGVIPRSFAIAAITFVSDEIRRSILRQQPDSLRLELRRVFRAFCHGSIISHRVRGNTEQKSVHIKGNRGLIAIRPRIKKAATVPPRMLQRALSKEDPPQH